MKTNELRLSPQKTDFHFTRQNHKAIVDGNLSKADIEIYIELRFYENSAEKPSLEEMITICAFTEKTFYKSFKKLEKLKMIPDWAKKLLTTQKAH